MTLKELSVLFNRALARSFDIWNYFFLFTILFLSGIVFIFFQAISFALEEWWQTILFTIPFFLVLGIILAGEMAILRRYCSDQENSLRKTIFSSWEIMIKASYFALPLFLAFLLFWILIALFLLLQSIPYLGTVLSVILAFLPFVLNAAILLLFVAALFILFYICPSIAIKNDMSFKSFQKRFQSNIFMNLLLLFIALVPLWIVYKFLAMARAATLVSFSVDRRGLEYLLQSFVIMIPFLAILTPAVNFFFNFAMEAELTLYLAHGEELRSEGR